MLKYINDARYHERKIKICLFETPQNTRFRPTNGTYPNQIKLPKLIFYMHTFSVGQQPDWGPGRVTIKVCRWHTYGARERGVQGSGGETWGKETIGVTQT